MVIFQPATGSQSMCRTVTIVDDIVLEGEEIFYVILETTDARVSLTLANSRASIVITDNDDSMSSLFFPTLHSSNSEHFI